MSTLTPGSEAATKAARNMSGSGSTRCYFDNKYIYTALSPRAHGLIIGININPDKHCNFDCVYCDIDRRSPSERVWFDTAAMVDELEATLDLVESGRIAERPSYQNLPPEVLRLRHVAFSGDGEPTLSEQFPEAVEAVVHLRARGPNPFFKLVLLTNASLLDRPEVATGLKHFGKSDEIWAKLDAGTTEYARRVNGPETDLARVHANILQLGRQRPVIIQSMFTALDGRGPSTEEIEAYAQRLLHLKNEGATISLVQVYSASRTAVRPECSHLPLKVLSGIAQRVRAVTGLRAEAF